MFLNWNFPEQLLTRLANVKDWNFGYLKKPRIHPNRTSMCMTIFEDMRLQPG